MESEDILKQPSFGEIVAEMRKATETSFVTTLVSRIEEWLKAAIETKMVTGRTKKFDSRLFGSYGPLSTFSAKIDIAYAFKIIDAATYADLMTIKGIRNDFAHSKSMLHFSSPEVANAIKKLSRWSPESDNQEIFVNSIEAVLLICKERIRDHVFAMTPAELADHAKAKSKRK